MSTKKQYKLSCIVSTVRELVAGPERTHVQVSIYGIQTVESYMQFSDCVNPVLNGASKTENFSDDQSWFILFGVDQASNTKIFQSMVYKSVQILIGVPGCSSVAIVLPKVRYGAEEVDMSSFVPGVIEGLRTAMADCTSIIKALPHKLYFVVPEGMKEPLKEALEQVE